MNARRGSIASFSKGGIRLQLLIVAAVLVVGCLLPWMRLVAPIGVVEMNGTDWRIGWGLLALGCLISSAALLGRPVGRLRQSIVWVVLSTLAIAAGVAAYLDVKERIAAVSASAVSARAGVGLYMVLAAGALGLAGAIAELHRAVNLPRTSSTDPPDNGIVDRGGR